MSPFWSHILQIILGATGVALLCFGADSLIRGGVAIARKAGVSPLLIGLTLVAFGTSAPELVVSISASMRGSGDIAVGNVVGSNICNIALILGLCALLRPIAVKAQLCKLEMPLLIGISALFIAFNFIDGRGLSVWQGMVFLFILATYLWWSFKTGKVDMDEVEGMDAPPAKLPIAILLVIAGLAGLTIGARLFVNSAVHFAKVLGVSEAVIGLTIVALGTSLPELATSVVAVLKNEKDIAIGNVIGSNIFNILAIMGVVPCLGGLPAYGVGLIDFAIMFGITLLLLPLMLTGKRISRGEGGFLLLIYAAYTGWLFYSAQS